MEVDVAQWRKSEHPLRDNASVTHYDDRIWSKSCQLGAELVVIFDFVRLNDWQSEFQRALFHWRCGRFQASAFRSIRLRNDHTDVESGIGEFFEGRDCKARCAAENELEGRRHLVIEQSCNFVIEPPRAGNNSNLPDYQITRFPNSSTILPLSPACEFFV